MFLQKDWVGERYHMHGVGVWILLEHLVGTSGRVTGKQSKPA